MIKVMPPAPSLIDPFRRLRDWLSTALAPALYGGPKEASRKRGRRARLTAVGMLIFSAGFAVRLLHWQDAQVQMNNDEAVISALARPYSQEAGKMINERRLLYPAEPFDRTDARMIIHPPGYSILVAAALKAFEGLDSLRLIQITGDSLAAVLVYIIVLGLLPAGAAVIAGLLVAFSPHLAFYSLWLTPESLSVLPVLGAVLLIICAAASPGPIKVVIAGALLGLSCWLRANGLLLAPFLAIDCLFLLDRKVRWRYAALLVATALVVISPITIRNWIVYHRFIPLSLGSGITLIEGIAEYDKENRFGLPATDREAAQKDGEWHDRPEYATSLWTPNGVERDRSRFARGLSVIRANPGWFAGVMLDRAFGMLRYNDSFGHGRHYDIASAPTLAAAPPFGHRLSDDIEPRQVWMNEPADLIGEGQTLARNAEAFVTGLGRAQILAGDDSGFADQFASAPIPVKRNTDYLLEVPVWERQGALAARISTADRRISLAAQIVRAPAREDEDFDESRVPQPPGPSPVTIIRIPFASGDRDEALLVISNNGPAPTRPAVQLGGVELFELGPTPHLWTRLPRELFRGIQKNIYKTTLMLSLILSGIALLALARMPRAALALLAVPFYYLSLQSFLHTEYRYIVVIHYFLFGLAAVPAFVAIRAALDLLGRARAPTSD
ncbi:MAG TPA: glycosyltransferase family 39 protein [Blastocatellia bacterium]|nr:glycosyltransferase family 39 protein [Blastocatellia bacterium]